MQHKGHQRTERSEGQNAIRQIVHLEEADTEHQRGEHTISRAESIHAVDKVDGIDDSDSRDECKGTCDNFGESIDFPKAVEIVDIDITHKHHNTDNEDLHRKAEPRREIQDIVANTRELDGQSDKRNSFDFALWKKASPEHIMRWPSPWSDGFPGWHCECTAMGRKYLGAHFDIHGGGMDLIFPHHENEIAQSEAANCCQFANYWLHNGYINVDNKKMSKSAGNFFMVRDAADENTDYEFHQATLQKIYNKWRGQGLKIFLNSYYIVLSVSGNDARAKLNQYGNYIESILAAYKPTVLKNNSRDNMARFFGRILSPISKPEPIRVS